MFKLTQILPPLFKTPRSTEVPSIKDLATDERLLEEHEIARDDSLCSGGYNEAFIIQHWTSYTPLN